MNARDRQLGITMWGMVFVLGVLAIAVFLVFKLLPPYLQDMKVRSALDSISRQPDFATMSKPELINALDKHFAIDDVGHVKLRDALTVESRGRTKVVRIRYETVVPLVFNVSALLDFDHQKEVVARD